METSLYPLMSLRDIVIFPHMVAPLVVGRSKSIHALEDAMEKRTEILLVAQEDSKVDDPEEGEIYRVGTLAVVMQLLRLPDGTIKALIEGKRRAEIVSFLPHEEFMQAEVRLREDTDADGQEAEVFGRRLRTVFENFAEINRKIPREVLKSVQKIETNSKLVDVVSAHLPLKSNEKQAILEIDSVPKRIEKVLECINREIELAELEKDINARVKKRMGKTQRNYFLGEKVKVIQNEIGQNEDGVDEIGELEQSLEKKNLPKIVRDKAVKELKKLRNMPPMSAETTVVRNYIDCILTLPWSKKTRARLDINKAEKILDEDHYGLEKPKERILEYLAVQAQVKKLQGPIICLVGPPGVGKTSITKSIARAMGRKFTRISLGGVRDEAEIRGHRRTYVGAMPGKIIQMMQKVGVANPVFCLDEVDKMSTDFRGDPSSALLEVLDPEQNNAFNDHYLDLDYDLSEIFFITTANNLEGIPLPLQDRMEIIRLNGYTEEEKQKIAEGYLIPKQLKLNGFKPDDITLTSGGILEIIRRYTREAGVRNFERTIASVFRKIARERLKSKTKSKKYKVSVNGINKYLGTPKFRFGLAEERNEVGLVTGLAWTSVGGELLQIEATLMPGTGKMMVTGKLGEVMQESAQAALSYVRSRAMRLGLAPDFYQKLDIHIHVPEGAVPKDGPSAGVTMATALVSAILKIPVDHEVAMTGEITLRGRVLPIGGLTEKLLAAKRGNVKTVLIPKENERNLADVPATIRKSLEVHCLDNVDQVLEKSLVLKDGETLFKDVPHSSVYSDFTLSSHNSPH
ncbi:ATP-dependent proteinase [Desulfocapsa sulfexigens DSM 10523]|uniref:Lon protease n=1 Tax=Desulfocapsa sulfexigens (strain DSM 10523 / SB164P1) TaxID=1167006 RepID=M1PSI9_DESSD|nr:endopeptidase La [Desulfocapsa sulfexigens]AGF79306.1 ATP-dependent proteinase [Desulfocapsa sulfexigens DSM 10523]